MQGTGTTRRPRALLLLFLPTVLAACAAGRPQVKPAMPAAVVAPTDAANSTSGPARIWLNLPQPAAGSAPWVFAARKSADYGPLTYDGTWLLLDQGAYAVIRVERVPAYLDLRVGNPGTSAIAAATWTVASAAVARIAPGAAGKATVTILEVGETDLIVAAGLKTGRLGLVVRPTTDGMVQVGFERSD